MKKTIAVGFLILFMASCGPKRMGCYGKRCVEVDKKELEHGIRNS